MAASRRSYLTTLKRIERELESLKPAARELKVESGLNSAIASVREAAIDARIS